MNEHAQIIDELGGTRAVSDAVGRHLSTVSVWRRRGISRDARLAVAQLALARGVRLPADFLVPLA